MKILVLCQYFFPEQFLINDIVPELVKRGHDVTVLTGRPNYPDGKIKKGYKKVDEYKGAKVIRAFEIGRSKGLLLNYVSFLKSANRQIKKLDSFDVVFTYELSPISMAAPLIKYKKKHPNVKSLLYCLDIWPESFNSHMPLKGIRKIIARYSKKVYQAYDRIAVTSRPFIDYLNRVNEIDYNAMVYLPQHAVGDLIEKDLTSNNQIPHFMFAGNLGKGQTLDVLIKALALVQKPFIMDFVGTGSCEKDLKQLALKLDIEEKVIFHGKKTYLEMEDMYKQADALLISLRGNNEVGNTLPGKFQTYMSAGKPIFGAINGATYELIKESKCGDCVLAGDYEGLSKILNDYLESPNKYKDCGQNAREYFKKHFTLEIYMNSLEKELLSL